MKSAGPPPPRFFAAERDLPFAVDPAAACHAVDLFRVNDPSGSETEWTVSVDPRGNLTVVLPHQREALPPPVLADINNQSLLGPLREIVHPVSVYLMAVASWSAGPNFPGVNDPFSLEGTVFGPFPSDTPKARTGRLATTRGDVLDGLVRGGWHAFNGAVEPLSKAPPPRWLHMMLAAGDDEQTRRGDALVLAYPLSQTELDLGCAGNEERVANLLFDLLSALKSDSPGTLLEGLLHRSPLPIPNLAALEAQLQARGFTVKGSVAKRPRKGFLGRFLQERIDLPPQGRVDEYLRLTRAVMEIFPDWPGDRAALLRPRTAVHQVSWTTDGPSGLRPVPVPNHKGEFVVQGGFLVSHAGFGKFHRCLYFKVDESYSRWNRGPAELTVEFQDGSGGFGVDYDTPNGEKTAGWHGMRGTAQWDSTTFSLPDSEFRGQGNGGTDFRLSIGSRRQFRVRRVFLRAVAGARPVLSSPPRPSDARAEASPQARTAAAQAAPIAGPGSGAPPTPRPLAKWGFDSTWTGMYDVKLRVAGDTLVLKSTGNDPAVQSPPVQIQGPVVVRLRMKSTGAGMGQIFWATADNTYAETQSRHFAIVHDGDWHEYRVSLVERDLITRLRLDVGDAPGKMEVSWMVVEPDTTLPTTAPIPGAPVQTRSRSPHLPPVGEPAPLAEWGFDAGWTALHQCKLQVVGEALVLENTGDDPHLQSPPVKIPGPVVVRLFMKSTAGGKGELFWRTRTMGGYESHPSQFEINHDGEWHEYRVTIYELGTIIRLRLDPGMAPGMVEVGWMIVEPFVFPVYQGTVTESARVLYFDGRYATCWMQAGGRMAEVLERRGFPTVDADHLRAWMQGRIKKGAPGSVCFLSQDAVPDTVLETDKADATIRRYLDAGGRVVLAGFVPFQDRGLPDGTRVYSSARERNRALGFAGHACVINEPPVLTEEGKAWGIQLPAKCDHGHVTARADVTTVLTSVGKHYASAYFRNYNPKYPHSGLVRYRSGEFLGGENEDIEDFLRVGLHGMPQERV